MSCENSSVRYSKPSDKKCKFAKMMCNFCLLPLGTWSDDGISNVFKHFTFHSYPHKLSNCQCSGEYCEDGFACTPCSKTHICSKYRPIDIQASSIAQEILNLCESTNPWENFNQVFLASFEKLEQRENDSNRENLYYELVLELFE